MSRRPGERLVEGAGGQRGLHASRDSAIRRLSVTRGVGGSLRTGAAVESVTAVLGEDTFKFGSCEGRVVGGRFLSPGGKLHVFFSLETP